MNKSVAIAVALVVIVAGGAAVYMGLFNPRPATETPASPAAATTEATSTTAANTGSAESSTTAPATTADATAGSTAPATAETAAAPAPAVTPQPVVKPDDHVLGSADAPVTIIEYASMTCPHCATFHAETMPRLKSEFIDKGQVRLVFRPFPLDGLALRASLLAECVPGDGYFEILSTLFAGQKDWIPAENPLDSLRAIGKAAGIEESKIDDCMIDEKEKEIIAAGYKEAIDVFGVNSTPSFIINGKKYAGALPFDDLESGGTKVSGLATIIRDLLPQ